VLNQGVIHADETPVQMLAPGEKKNRRAYVWAYSTTPFSALKAVVYDFSPSRAGEHARSCCRISGGRPDLRKARWADAYAIRRL
jgi:hypothetical protein